MSGSPLVQEDAKKGGTGEFNADTLFDEDESGFDVDSSTSRASKLQHEQGSRVGAKRARDSSDDENIRTTASDHDPSQDGEIGAADAEEPDTHTPVEISASASDQLKGKGKADPASNSSSLSNAPRSGRKGAAEPVKTVAHSLMTTASSASDQVKGKSKGKGKGKGKDDKQNMGRVDRKAGGKKRCLPGISEPENKRGRTGDAQPSTSSAASASSSSSSSSAASLIPRAGPSAPCGLEWLVPLGNVMVVLGHSGVGKSTAVLHAAAQFAHINPGSRIMYIDTEERKRLIEDTLAQLPRVYSRFDRSTVRVQNWCPQARQQRGGDDFQELVQSIRAAAIRGYNVFIIDTFTFSGVGHSQYYTCVRRLGDLAHKMNIAIVLVCHLGSNAARGARSRRPEAQAAGSADITRRATFVAVVYQPIPEVNGQFRIRIELAKSNHPGILPVAGLEFNRHSRTVRMCSPPPPIAPTAQEDVENILTAPNVGWMRTDDLMAELHRRGHHVNVATVIRYAKQLCAEGKGVYTFRNTRHHNAAKFTISLAQPDRVLWDSDAEDTDDDDDGDE